jgi:hypothetical protein
VFIGSVKGPHHNSPADSAEVWCSPNQVELNLFIAVVQGDKKSGLPRNLDPIAARNLAALLIRASEEAERMAARRTVSDGGVKSASLCLEHGGVGYRENCTECRGKGVTVP